MSIPKLKKKVTDFFLGEEASISKDKLLKTGVAIAGVAVSAGVTLAGHTNDCNQSPDCGSNCGPVHANVLSLKRNITGAIDGNHCNGESTHANSGSGHCNCKCYG